MVYLKYSVAALFLSNFRLVSFNVDKHAINEAAELGVAM